MSRGGDRQDEAWAVAIDSQGRILIVGESEGGGGHDIDDDDDDDDELPEYMVLLRFKSDGSLDDDFGTDGVALFGEIEIDEGHFWAQDLVIDEDGKIVVVGGEEELDDDDDEDNIVVWRFNDDGTLDSTFGGLGVVILDDIGEADDGDEDAHGVALDSQGRILITGHVDMSDAGDDESMFLVRLTRQGTLDGTFGDNGVVTENNAVEDAEDEEGSDIAVDSQWRIVVVGFAGEWDGDDDMVVWRFLSNGDLDTDFADDGIFVHHNAGGGEDDDWANSVVIDSSGNIIVVGGSDTAPNEDDDLVIWRLDDDGDLDTSFGFDGIVTYAGPGWSSGDDDGLVVVLDAEGKIVVSGLSAQESDDMGDMAIWRFESDGDLDTTFGDNGVFIHSDAAGGDSIDGAIGLAFDSCGRIVAAGLSDTDDEIEDDEDDESDDNDIAVWRVQ